MLFISFLCKLDVKCGRNASISNIWTLFQYLKIAMMTSSNDVSMIKMIQTNMWDFFQPGASLETIWYVFHHLVQFFYCKLISDTPRRNCCQNSRKIGHKTIFCFQFPPFPPFQCWVWFFIHENKSEQYSPTLKMGGEGGNAWLGKNRRRKLITQILKNMTRIPLISNFWQQILSQSVWKYKRRMLGQLSAGRLSNAVGSIKHQLELDWNKSDRYLLK